MPRTPTIGQVLSQAKTAWQHANKITANISKNLTKTELFAGLIKVYQPNVSPDDDPTVYQEAPESVPVQFRVEPELTRAVKEVYAPALNLTAAREWANQSARADIIIDGKVLLADVPATYLLFLEHQVTELRASILSKIPTLDPKFKWIPSTEEGVWQTAEPERRYRDEKTEEPREGHPGNEHHAPQIKWLPKSVITGVKVTTKYSGAIEPQRKEELLRRLHVFEQALHSAREEANRTQAPEHTEGTKWLEWLFA